MLSFFLFFVILSGSFLLEQSVLLPFGLSPGGLFVSFFVFIAGLFFLIGDVKWLFLLAGGAMAGIFSAMPFFSFLLFVCAGALFLLLKPFLPIERVFSLLAALWLGAVLYVFVFSLFWGARWLFGFSDAATFRSFVLFFASVVFFAFGVLVPFSMVWWLLLYRRRNRQYYALNAKR